MRNGQRSEHLPFQVCADRKWISLEKLCKMGKLREMAIFFARSFRKCEKITDVNPPPLINESTLGFFGQMDSNWPGWYRRSCSRCFSRSCSLRFASPAKTWAAFVALALPSAHGKVCFLAGVKRGTGGTQTTLPNSSIKGHSSPFPSFHFHYAVAGWCVEGYRHVPRQNTTPDTTLSMISSRISIDINTTFLLVTSLNCTKNACQETIRSCTRSKEHPFFIQQCHWDGCKPNRTIGRHKKFSNVSNGSIFVRDLFSVLLSSWQKMTPTAQPRAVL